MTTVPKLRIVTFAGGPAVALFAAPSASSVDQLIIGIGDTDQEARDHAVLFLERAIAAARVACRERETQW